MLKIKHMHEVFMIFLTQGKKHYIIITFYARTDTKLITSQIHIGTIMLFYIKMQTLNQIFTSFIDADALTGSFSQWLLLSAD